MCYSRRISTEIIESIDGIVEEENLAQGNYSISITDIHNCEPFVINETLEANNPPNVNLIANNGPTWVEGDNGFIEIELSQGTSPYNYSWTGPNGFTSTNQNIYNLVEGTYYLTIEDNNGGAGLDEIVGTEDDEPFCDEFTYNCSVDPNCSVDLNEIISIASIIITDPEEIVDNASLSEYCDFPYNISGNSLTDGSINLNPSGGVPFEEDPYYTFEWIGPNGFTSTEQNISNLEAGTYIVTISDSETATNIGLDGFIPATFEFTLIEPDELIITENHSNFNGYGVSCFESCDAEIMLEINGGCEPYEYIWNGPEEFNSTEQNISNICSGTYSVTVTDANGNTVSEENIIITEPEDIIITEFLESNYCEYNLACNGDETGSFIEIISVSGGTPFVNDEGFTYYEYYWLDTDNNTQNIYDILPGSYSLVITDSNGCSKEFDFEVTEPDVLTVNIVTTLATNCLPDGTAVAEINGGCAPYEVIWYEDINENGTFEEDDVITQEGFELTTDSGTYWINNVDANG